MFKQNLPQAPRRRNSIIKPNLTRKDETAEKEKKKDQKKNSDKDKKKKKKVLPLESKEFYDIDQN